MIRSKRLLHVSMVGEGFVYFDNSDEDIEPTTEIALTKSDVALMGNPEEITVTIEPGDTLNDHPKGSL